MKNSFAFVAAIILAMSVASAIHSHLRGGPQAAEPVIACVAAEM
jgi:hypothetical protein